MRGWHKLILKKWIIQPSGREDAQLQIPWCLLAEPLFSSQPTGRILNVICCCNCATCSQITIISVMRLHIAPAGLFQV